MTASTYDDIVTTTRRLIAEKDAIEDRIRSLEQVLSSQNLTMTTPLTDADGFPRADIDVYNIRHVRVEIIRLRNDHQEMMGRIEKALAEVHEGARREGRSGVAGGEGGNEEALSPFAKIDAVAPDSPASAAGLARNDLILRFATITATSHTEPLKQLPSAVVENQRIKVLVLRNGEKHDLALVPRKWGGRGLLGCHLVPL
ncbi:uncharacterized protein EV422DRAFT_569578 [Fimicolochytrium jonesii]|uniref:uncharacterized protein n=1 Tax=Fimicolochytrium jonesii TaxID=1396493 RepID=UPI0022FEB432|nr:uncharacterized protein EV422DRAFT_569578 [Fimicolochytrium jonesii]KAI8818526.1 hypothetical protein EV422DRAFT_569578 [Fimicolochytrium jonesii]